MKHSRSDIRRKTHKIPAIRFEDQSLTSFSGLVVFQPLFAQLNIKERLRACFSHLLVSPIFGHHVIVLLLVVHLLLGYRELRDIRYYRDDPLVKRLLGLRRLPDVATVRRTLASAGRRRVDDGNSLSTARRASVLPDRAIRSEDLGQQFCRSSAKPATEEH